MEKEHDAWASKGRSDLILQILHSRRSVKVTELCAMLKLSEITIRRTLNEMADKGLVIRVHGGAMLGDTGEDTLFFDRRAKQNQLVKQMLAKEAVKLLPPSGSIYLDSGSTCLQVAREVANSGKEYLIVTDNILIPQEIFGMPRVETMLLGGTLARDKVTIDGYVAQDNAKKFALDFCLFSANGFTTQEISNYYLSGVATKETMIKRAKKSICIIDSTKYNNQSRFHFCRWDDVDEMITDSALSPDAMAAITSQGVKIHSVNVDNHGG